MPLAYSKIIILLALILASPAYVNAQRKTRYFNEQNNEVTKKEFADKNSTNYENTNEISRKDFRDKKRTRQYLEVPGDSANFKKLIYRQQEGAVDQVTILYDLLAKATRRKLDTAKVLVVIYHPGGEGSNTSGTADDFYYKFWYAQLEQGLKDVAQVQPVYVSKDISGIEKSKAFLPWVEDPEGVVEKLFFKYYYRGGSFVVISPAGKYISYFGEFPKEYVWEAAERLKS